MIFSAIANAYFCIYSLFIKITKRTSKGSLKTLLNTFDPPSSFPFNPKQKNQKQIKNAPKSEGLFGHDVVEVLSTDFSAIGGSSLEHFFEFRHVHGLAEFLGHSLDVINVDEPSSVVIEQVEDFIDTVLNLNI